MKSAEPRTLFAYLLSVTRCDIFCLFRLYHLLNRTTRYFLNGYHPSKLLFIWQSSNHHQTYALIFKAADSAISESYKNKFLNTYRKIQKILHDVPKIIKFTVCWTLLAVFTSLWGIFSFDRPTITVTAPFFCRFLLGLCRSFTMLASNHYYMINAKTKKNNAIEDPKNMRTYKRQMDKLLWMLHWYHSLVHLKCVAHL